MSETSGYIQYMNHLSKIIPSRQLFALAQLHIELKAKCVCTSYCMSAQAIRQILASSPRAAGPRMSTNIMTYSPHTNVITSLLHDHQCQYIILALWSVPYIIYCHSGTFELSCNKHIDSSSNNIFILVPKEWDCFLGHVIV